MPPRSPSGSPAISSRPPARPVPRARRETKAEPEAVAALVGLVETKAVNRGGAREVLAVLVAEGGEPAEIVERLDLGATSDSGELEAIVDRAIEAAAGCRREGARRGRARRSAPSSVPS